MLSTKPKAVAHKRGSHHVARGSNAGGTRFLSNGRWHEPRLVIFAYHGVTPSEPVIEASGGLHLSLATFERHCQSLVSEFQPISLDNFLRLEYSSSAKPYALVTFDDIYDNVVRAALPILEQYQLPFMVFLSTSYVGRARRFWWDDVRLALLTVPYVRFPVGDIVVQLGTREARENAITVVETALASLPQSDREQIILDLLSRSEKFVQRVFARVLSEWLPLTEDSLQRLELEKLCNIGLHSHSHPALIDIAPANLREELGSSQGWYRSRYGRSAPDICFPFGECNEAVIEACQAADFKRGFTLEPTPLHTFTRPEPLDGLTIIKRSPPLT